MTLVTITSNKNSATNWTLLDTNLLICSLFTLLPSDILFCELNINKYSYTKRISEYNVIIDSKHLGSLYLLLNKPLVRQLAHNILQPLIPEITNAQFLNLSKKSDSFEHQTLEKYIKKFKYFYKLFFSERFWLSKYQLTEKEINVLAIKLLFILVGI
jgi:hypothetical protein